MPIDNERLARSADLERATVRRTLRLEASATADREPIAVVVLNLSETGLLIQTAGKLEVGAEVEVSIPDRQATKASVVWMSDDLFGCQFEKPIPTATVSASLLLAPPEARRWPEHGIAGPFEQRRFVPRPEDVEEVVERWPPRTRLAAIFALTVASWGLVGGIVALIIAVVR